MTDSTRINELGNDLRAATRGVRRVALWASFAGLMIWLCSGVVSIKANEAGVVRLFGRYDRTYSEPGLKFLLPWPIERLERVSTKVNSLLAGFAPDEETMRFHIQTEMSYPYCLTADQNIVHVSVVAQYKVKNPERYMYGVVDVPALLRSVLNDVIIINAAGMEVDSVLTDGKELLRDNTLVLANQILDDLDSGVSITRVQLQTIQVPGETKAAFDAVTTAKLGMRRAEAEAQKYQLNRIGEANGQYARVTRQAEIESNRRIEKARADVDEFKQRLEQYKLDRSIERVRMYLETMGDVMSRVKVYVLPRGSVGQVPRSALPPPVLNRD